MRRTALLAGIMLAAGSPADASDGDVERGKAVAKEWGCTTCHGLTGNERSPRGRAVPMLAGQPAGYLSKTLRDYRSGVRVDNDDRSKMTFRAKALSDSDIDDLSAYYAVQKRY